VAALLAPIAIGGWNLSFDALIPKFEKLDPAAGLARIFSPRSLVELAKAFAKFLFIAPVAAWLLWSHTGELMGLGAEPVERALTHAATLAGHAFLVLAGTLGLIAAIDVPIQLWQHNQKLKMSRQELKEEAKESDGSPEMKGRIRRAQQELARRRMMQEVPKANVIVTNPTHFAVALQYDEKRMRAPIVVAKGADLIAARIREVATEHNVPIFEAPPLARALHRHVDLGGEIPSNLYVAVAQVLTYIYQMKAARNYGAVMPQPPTIDPALDPDLTRH
jgi:flagellar biosynthetic protein FlhB